MKRLFLSLSILSITLSCMPALYADVTNDEHVVRWLLESGRRSRGEQSYFLDLLDKREKLVEEGNALKDELRNLEAGNEDREGIHAKIAGNEKLLARLDGEIEKCKNSNSSYGSAIMLGLAGHDAKGLFDVEKIKIENWREGVVAGLVYRFADALGDKITETTRIQIGGIWDSVVGGVLRGIKTKVQGAWYWLFHGGHWPLAPKSVLRWKQEVCEVVLRDLAERARLLEREQSNGGQSNMRSLFEETDKWKDAQELPDARKDPMWMNIAQGYANTIDYVVVRLEKHKPFYFVPDQDGGHGIEGDIISLINRLQETLLLFKENILMKSESLKELAGGDLKQLLPAIERNISYRFDLLIESINDYHGNRSETVANSQPEVTVSDKSERPRFYR